MIAPIVLSGFCVWSVMCYAVLSVIYSCAIILMMKRERELEDSL